MKAREIRDLIDFISKTGLNEVNIETDEFKISVKKNPDVNLQAIDTVGAPISSAPYISHIESSSTKQGSQEEMVEKLEVSSGIAYN